ncbi:TRAF3-interacting protein 1 [Ciona intestinalis]
MDPKIIKKTKDTMGTIIKKPPLTDKLLGKPPFRFLHDIITEVIRTSGFLKGLFTSEEMDSKNVTAKEDKLAFLQKVIDCVGLVSGDTLSVRPNKVIAGHEPEKTNELLQVMAKCIMKNKSSADAVQQMLTGKSSKSSKPKYKPPSGVKRGEVGEKPEREEGGRERKKKSSDHNRDRSHDKRRPSADKERRRERERSSDNRPEHHEEAEEEQDHGRKKRKSKKHQNEIEPPTPQIDSSNGREENEDQNGNEENVGLRENAEGAESNAPVVRAPRPASAKGQRRKPYSGGRSKPDVQQEENEEAPVAPRKLARPPSARPAAPRVRQRQNAADQEIDRIASGGQQRSAPIIVDRNLGATPSDDDDDQFVVEDADPMLQEEPTGLSNTAQMDEDEEHGGLVRKILETKKELEQSAAGKNKVEKHTEIQRTNVTTAQQRKERELVAKEIDRLRNSVQTLCQSATPLAKIIDYIQEDMDAMQNELVFWQKENTQHAVRLKDEEEITSRAVEPLKHELEELERSISTYRNQMAATKANIIRNQEKIHKMVSAVAARS